MRTFWSRLSGSLRSRFLLAVVVPFAGLMAIVILAVDHGVEEVVREVAAAHHDSLGIGPARLDLGTEAAGALARLRWLLFLLAGAAVPVAVLGSAFLARRVIASVDDLVRGTIAVSKGDLDHRIETDAGGEIAALAAHFNHMTSQVRRHQQETAIAKRELEVLNATLEEKVNRRTHELLASEEKYRTLVDSTPDPILIVQGTKVRFANPAFDRTFGRSTEDSVGRPDLEAIFHEDDREEVRQFVERVLAGHPTVRREVRGIAASGEAQVFEMRGLEINYLGSPAAELILMDTTERKELQDHLLQHEKLRALGELASGVAHDFNNILGIILGRAQLLQRVVGEGEVQRGLRTIERAAYDGGETVRRIQDFARSRTERNFESLDLNELLSEVVEITRTRWKDQAEVRGIKIDVSLELGDVRPIRGNASEIREVYTNLIFNAVDAMPEGGHIRIRSGTERQDTVVEVRDTGTGMSEDVRARIFDPFFSTKGSNGMGLGMSVVFGIIARHKGKITVESEPGDGTTFTIRIPRASEDSVIQAAAPTSMEARSSKILVIDDEKEIADLVTDILEADGHSVAYATSGPEGLARLESEPFDLLLCDLGMRDMTGWEVVRAVRERDEAIGIALLTGWGATLDEAEVASHGVDSVVNKPFEMRKLQEAVAALRKVADARRAADSAGAASRKP